jgi:hypothetical protein
MERRHDAVARGGVKPSHFRGRTDIFDDIFDFALTSEEVQAINALDIGKRGGPDPEQVNPQTFPITIQD